MPEMLAALVALWQHATEHHPLLALIFWLLVWLCLLFSGMAHRN